jgi:uncharacterized protein
VAGETELPALLAAMAPVLRVEEYVFCTLPPGAELPAGVVPFAAVREDEGLSLVVERAHAGDLRCSAPFRAITLTVHSSLEAVGLTAAVARALADLGIPANVVAGFHHDHVFVPADHADEALRALLLLTRFG